MADPKPNHSRLTTSRLAHEAEGGALGALAGTALGSLAGPPGMVVGALIRRHRRRSFGLGHRRERPA
jgi:hypothetical protein